MVGEALQQLENAGGSDSPVPQHVAIIMDGNGRWAKARGLPRTAGHHRGMEAVRAVIEAAGEMGISYLTLFGFSSENWSRPAGEVSDLMGLLRLYLKSEVKNLHKNNVRLRVIGERQRLAEDIQKLIADAENLTAGNTGLNVSVALSYGGRQDLVQAARQMAVAVQKGELDPEDIDEAAFQQGLWTNDLPDPDLLIRTSGEQRISNFLLWQLAYSEFVFVDTLWPDFGRDDLAAAIGAFGQRDRRFGGING